MYDKLLREINIFISSPSDVQEERNEVVRAIELLNNLEHVKSKYSLTPLAYERATPALIGDSPQDVVNKYMMRAKESDIYICIMWQRFGTQTISKTGEIIQSGTEFEFREAYDTNQKLGKPYILLYRCTRAIDLDADLEQTANVDKFFQQFEGIGAKLKGLYRTYNRGLL